MDINHHYSREGALEAHILTFTSWLSFAIQSCLYPLSSHYAQASMPRISLGHYNKHAHLHSTGLVYVQTSSMAQIQILDPFHRLHSLHRHIYRWLPLRVHRPRPPLFPRRPLRCPRRRCANVALHLPHDLWPDHDDGGSDCRLGGQCRLF